mgnify:CR=1 FL=1
MQILASTRRTHYFINVFSLVNFLRYLSLYLKKVTDTMIQRNLYFPHPENILVTMTNDEDTSVRKLGLKRIIKVRKNVHNPVS